MTVFGRKTLVVVVVQVALAKQTNKQTKTA